MIGFAIELTKGTTDGLLVFACICGAVALGVWCFRSIGDTVNRWDRALRR